VEGVERGEPEARDLERGLELEDPRFESRLLPLARPEARGEEVGERPLDEGEIVLEQVERHQGRAQVLEGAGEVVETQVVVGVGVGEDHRGEPASDVLFLGQELPVDVGTGIDEYGLAAAVRRDESGRAHAPEGEVGPPLRAHGAHATDPGEGPGGGGPEEADPHIARFLRNRDDFAAR
jgi:hypothetical protein